MNAPRPVLASEDGTTLAVAPDAGGRVASLRIAGRERLVTEPSDRPRLDWGCFLMAPWVGRLAHATLPLAGQTHELVADHGAHAIHGVALDAEWHVESATTTRAVLAAELDPARWPPGGDVRQELTLGAGRAILAATVVARERPMPAALGWHPWFARPGSGDVALRCDADRVLITDTDLIPDGATTPADGPLDLRAGPLLGQRRLDHCYVGVREPVVLTWPDLSLAIRSDAATYVVHTPERGVCAEPQTAWPNAPVLDASGVAGTGLVHLEPGGSLTLTTELTWHRGTDA